MKKILITLALFMCILPMNTSKVSATNLITERIVSIEDLGNGYSITTSIVEDEMIATNRSTKTKSGYKKVTYAHDDTVLWTVQVNGMFSYTGTSAVCISSTVTTTCPSSAWKISNKSSSKSGNTAYASATGKQYLLGICIQTVNRTVSLKCSNTGVLS